MVAKYGPATPPIAKLTCPVAWGTDFLDTICLLVSGISSGLEYCKPVMYILSTEPWWWLSHSRTPHGNLGHPSSLTSSLSTYTQSSGGAIHPGIGQRDGHATLVHSRLPSLHWQVLQ